MRIGFNMASYWKKNFNTKLSPKDEAEFQVWMRSAKADYGTDLEGDLNAYDLRGFWKAGGHKDKAFARREGHAPDTFKKPNHPTFSDESIYHGADGPLGRKLVGGKWLSENEFRPSREMLRSTHGLNWYLPFMREHGEGVRVNLDELRIF